MRDSGSLRTRYQLRSLRLLCCLAAALASSSSGFAASGGVLAWPFGSAPAQEQEEQQQEEQQQQQPEQQARLEAVTAWEQLPAATRDRIGIQLAPLDNAHRLALLDTVPSLRALSQEQKQMLLDELSPSTMSGPPQGVTDTGADRRRRRRAPNRIRNAVRP